MSFCVDCGAEVFSGSEKCIKCSLGVATPTSSDLNKPAKRTLFIHPISKDWTYWLFLVLVALTGAQNNFWQGSQNSGSALGAAMVTGVFAITIYLVSSFLLFAVLPAFIRKLFLSRRDRKALDVHPTTDTAGWHQDPLDPNGQRWWDGHIWTQATLPRLKLLNTVSKLLAGAIVAVLVVAFGAGMASNPSTNSTNSSNAMMMVGLAFEDLATAAQNYNSIRIDPADPLGNLAEVQDAFLDIRTNHTLLKGALGSVANQEELGAGAPSLESLNAMIEAMDPYIQIRSDYYEAIEQCSPIVPDREVTDCDLDVFAEYERPMVDSIAPVATTWEAVFASIPNN